MCAWLISTQSCCARTRSFKPWKRNPNESKVGSYEKQKNVHQKCDRQYPKWQSTVKAVIFFVVVVFHLIEFGLVDFVVKPSNSFKNHFHLSNIKNQCYTLRMTRIYKKKLKPIISWHSIMKIHDKPVVKAYLWIDKFNRNLNKNRFFFQLVLFFVFWLCFVSWPILVRCPNGKPLSR